MKYLENKVAKLVMQTNQAFDHLLMFKLDKVNYYTHYTWYIREITCIIMLFKKGKIKENKISFKHSLNHELN